MTFCIIQMRAVDNEANCNPSTIKLQHMDPDRPWKEECGKVLSVLKDWKNAALADQEDLSVAPPSVTSLSPAGKDKLLKLVNGEVILNSLVETCYPWAHGPSTGITKRLQSATAVALNSLLLYMFEQRQYSSLEGFKVLRGAISQILIENTSAFKGFWDNVEEVASIETETCSPVPNSSQQPFSTRAHVSLASRATEIQKRTKEAVREIIALVSNKDVGAIPVAIDENTGMPQPHEDVYHAAVDLIQAVAIASHRAQTIYADPTADRCMQLNRRQITELYKALDVPATFCPAPENVTEAYYTNIDMKELTEIEAMGDGSKALQRRVEAAERSRVLKEQRARLLLPGGKESLLQDDRLIKLEPGQNSDLPPSSPISDGPTLQPTQPVTDPLSPPHVQTSKVHLQRSKDPHQRSPSEGFDDLFSDN